VAKLSRKAWLEILAVHAAREAKLGNVWPLRGRVGGVPDDYLSPEERKFLFELLEKNDGRRGKAEIKRIDIFLARQVADAFQEQKRAEGRKKPSKKDVFGEVRKERGRGMGRSSLYEKFKKPK
jgi:hypothetical protein